MGTKSVDETKSVDVADGLDLPPGVTSSGLICKFRLHWSDDERHNKVDDHGRNLWEERQKRKYAYDPTMMAQELEIDYGKSVKGRYLPQADYVNLGRFAYDPLAPLYVGWDFGRTDAAGLVWVQWSYRRNRPQVIDAFQKSGMTIDFFVPLITGQVPSGTKWTYTEREVEMIQRHRDWVVTEHYGDPAGRQRNPVTNTSVLDELAKAGIHVYTNTQAVRFETRRTALQKMLLRMDMDEKNCVELDQALRNAKFRTVSVQSEVAASSGEPVHDWTSHLRSALEYVAVNLREMDEVYHDATDADPERLYDYAHDDEEDGSPPGRGLAGY